MQNRVIPAARVVGCLRSSSTVTRSLVIAIAAIAMSGSALATPPLETILYNFVGANGGYPDGPLVVGPGLNIFGTTAYGGATNHGSIFELVPPVVPENPWTQVVLYSFTGGADGAQPAAGLVFDTSGALYGTTETSAGGGHGVVFKLTPPVSEGPWTETTIYGFAGVPDGANPNCGLTFDTAGNLYGTTTAGGRYNAGSVFKLVPTSPGTGPWTESVVYSFTGQSDGGSPFANLVQDTNGIFYGTTTTGGKTLNGTVFSLKPSVSGPVLTTLYSFTGGADGGIPYAPVTVGSKGAIFGTTFFGGETVSGVGSYGVVFELSPPVGKATAYSEATIFEFNGTNGANPSGGLVPDGNGGFYGTTAGGVAGYGNVFDLTPPVSGKIWTESVVYAFSGTGNDGQSPLGKVALSPDGNIFGTTYYGGTWGEGTAFQLNLNSCPAIPSPDC